jgi:4-deoxy-L-threo-5-hexosulose-uronate ketol-isomerase
MEQSRKHSAAAFEAAHAAAATPAANGAAKPFAAHVPQVEVRHQQSQKEVRGMDTAELRSNFLIRDLMRDERIGWVYTHYDRMMIGGVRPTHSMVPLISPSELRADSFLSRRELGIINVGNSGAVVADGKTYPMERLDCLYLGKGTGEVCFESEDPSNPAAFYLLSVPAHQTHPARLMKRAESSPAPMGDLASSNKRVIYKYIHPEGIRSCQLVMGLTILEDGCVWNSFPPHTHDRRMESYFYFDVPDNQRVFHFMGEPAETRHIVMSNHEAVISPPWSMHFGCGTSSYGFIWGMAGENQVFSDMDPVGPEEIF